MDENVKVTTKDLIREEYIKCLKSCAYFLKKYCYISHPQRGRIAFNLYPFQEKVLQLWQENNYSIVCKSRQLGISTLAAGYSMWIMLFNPDKNILVIATKQDTAKNMVTKVTYMYNNLPSWLREQIRPPEESKLTLKLNNGSQIKAVSAASDSGRSEACSLLLMDESAYIEGAELLWASAQQTLASGGGCIAMSTPNGTGNWFHKTWVKAELNENEFLPIKLPWFVHPERDQAWRNKQDELLGDPRIAAQECDAEYNTSGDTVFYNEIIEFISQTTISEPLERRGVDKNLWIWEPADYSQDYIILADVARGDGKDYSSAHVMNIQTNVQVAEYKGQLPPKEFGYFLIGLATEYNQGLLVIENANIGWSTVETVLERGYKNVYYSPKGDRITVESYFNKFENNQIMVPGFTMSQRTRPLVISKFIESVNDKSVTIQSKRLLDEMKVFIWRNGRPEAQNGYNDDLVMPFGVGQYLRETSLRYKQQSQDLARAVLDNISSHKTQYKGAYFASGKDNPYSMPINQNENEDFSWLIK